MSGYQPYPPRPPPPNSYPPPPSSGPSYAPGPSTYSQLPPPPAPYPPQQSSYGSLQSSVPYVSNDDPYRNAVTQVGNGNGYGSGQGHVAGIGSGSVLPPQTLPSQGYGNSERRRSRDGPYDGHARGRGGRGGRGGGRDRNRERSPGGRRPPRASADRERENGSVASRIAKERPCRTLFVRNVNYEADNMRLRADFESYGDVKDIYDMIQTRGMMFITYYDLRTTDRARVGMHGTLINGRPIDVHYSLPKGDDRSSPCNREKNQGSLLAVGRDIRFLDERQLGDEAARYGAVKIVRYQREPFEKLLEFYDSRDAVRFFDAMDGRPFAGGQLQLRFVWDDLEADDGDLSSVDTRNGAGTSMPPPAAPSYPPGRDHNRTSNEPPFQGGGGYDRGGSRDRADSYGAQQDHYAQRPPPLENQSYGANRYSDRPPSVPTAGYASGPPGVPPGPIQSDDRLEQARKVQQLLANLGSAAAPPAAGSLNPPSNRDPGPPPPPGQAYGYGRNERDRSAPGSYGGSGGPPLAGQTHGHVPPPPMQPAAAPPQGGQQYGYRPPQPQQQAPLHSQSYSSALPPRPPAPSQPPQPQQSYPPYLPATGPGATPAGDPRLLNRPPVPSYPPPPIQSGQGAQYGSRGPPPPSTPPQANYGGHGRPPPPPQPQQGYAQGYQPSQPSAGGDLSSILANLANR